MSLVLSGSQGISADGINWNIQPSATGVTLGGGIVTTPGKPGFIVYDTRLNTPTSAANLNISQYFTTVEANIGGHYNTANGRFTAPVNGYYLFGWNFFTTGIAAGTSTRCGLNKNGSTTLISMGDVHPAAGNCTVGVYLVSGDYITLGTQGGTYTAYWYSSSIHSRYWGFLVG